MRGPEDPFNEDSPLHCADALQPAAALQVGRLPSSTKSWTTSLLLLRRQQRQQRRLAAMQLQEGEWTAASCLLLVQQ
jgi:hypothetical protein